MSVPQMCEGLVKYVLTGTSRGPGSTNVGPVMLPQPVIIYYDKILTSLCV